MSLFPPLNGDLTKIQYGLGKKFNTNRMKKDKLDKIANTIIEQMGDLKLVKQTMVRDDREELMSILIGIDFIVTENVPLINLLHQTVDRDSFTYIMNRVGEYLSSFYGDDLTVTYDSKYDMYYYFKI